MRELFVYYRVSSSDAAAVQAAVHEMQAQLRAESPALVTRLLRRPGDNDGLQTWMETYSAPLTSDGVTPTLQARIEAQALVLAPLIAGPRHTEVFVACAS